MLSRHKGIPRDGQQGLKNLAKSINIPGELNRSDNAVESARHAVGWNEQLPGDGQRGLGRFRNFISLFPGSRTFRQLRNALTSIEVRLKNLVPERIVALGIHYLRDSPGARAQ